MHRVAAIAPSILGAIAKLRKATVGFILSVCPRVRMEQLGFHWTDSMIFCPGVFVRKSVDKIQVWLKSG
jgi:hypothetical protein